MLMTEHSQQASRGKLEQRSFVKAMFTTGVIADGDKLPRCSLVFRSKCVRADWHFRGAKRRVTCRAALGVGCREHGRHPVPFPSDDDVPEGARLIRIKRNSVNRTRRPGLAAVPRSPAYKTVQGKGQVSGLV